jgi:peptidoglycan/xylan/chitin deacetylase (PgdA/CDA1 family)
MRGKQAVVSLSSILPFGQLKKFANGNLVAPFYHIISDSKPAHIKHLYPIISIKQFEQDLDFLIRNFYPVDLNELVKIDFRIKKFPKPPLFLSFDDGFREVATIIAPILLSKGVPATFFVNPSFVGNNDMLFRCKISIIVDRIISLGSSFRPTPFFIDRFNQAAYKTKTLIGKILDLGYGDSEIISGIARELEVDFNEYLIKNKPYLNLEELKKMAETGFSIGAHSMDHPLLSEITVEQQISQMLKSINWVQKNIPNQPKAFAFPFTDFGVSKEFYSNVNGNFGYDGITMFGSAGLKPVLDFPLIHRIPMEIKNKSARDVLKGDFFYFYLKRILGKHTSSVLQ